MNEKNREKLVEGILFYREAIKNSSDKEYIERCQKKIEEYIKQLKITEFENEVEYNKISNNEIKRKIILDYYGEIDQWN